ncbi:MAG TPA: hypothetical protein DIW24_05800 [Bacteroidetes bacterium]|nr:hypothetical protein [Bacteroidota bacterium]HRR08520.1 hypothetical protein [Rhodothermales bacterium]
MDYRALEGGLRRMLDRLHTEGTATKNAEADAFLRENNNAKLLGMLFDQRILAEVAFIGPLKLHQRMGHLDMQKIAYMAPKAFNHIFAMRPAVHRFSKKMAETTQKVAHIIATEYENDAAAIWQEAPDWDTVTKRLRNLPGFGAEKCMKFRYVLHYFGERTF